MAQEIDVIVIEEVEYLPLEESDETRTEESKKLDDIAMKGAKKAQDVIKRDERNIPGDSMFTK